MTDQTLSNLLHEERKFPPTPEFAAQANVKAEAYERAASDRLAFWEEAAGRLDWARPWDTVLDWSNAPFAKWFVGGTLNAAYNCVDRHVVAGHGDRVAYHWEGEPGDTRTITYADLQQQVCRATNALLELGVRKGDRVALYLPMIPETVVAMLACARLGNDALGTELLREQRLADCVIDLVRAGVCEILAFEPKLRSPSLRQSSRVGKCRRAADPGGKFVLEARLKLLAVQMRAHATLQTFECRNEGLRNVAPAERAKAPARVGEFAGNGFGE